MRALILSILMVPMTIHAQLKPGFDPVEARDMASLCTIHTFDDLYGDHRSMIPDGYEHVYSSVPSALDNKFEIFRKGDLAIVEIRGSTAEASSWMVNVYSSMIPAKGTLRVNGEPFTYYLASDTAAAVHAGYTLALSTIAKDVVKELYAQYQEGVRDVIITGHSQGGALAHLLRAYVENAPPDVFLSKMKFKTYSLAGPMVGNKAFADEYERNYCTDLSSFSLVNPADFAPKMPISFDPNAGFSLSGMLTSMLSGQQDFQGAALSGLMALFGGSLMNMTQSATGSIEKQVEAALGEVEMPPFKNDMSYKPMPKRIDIEPFDYPLILKDPTILENDSIMRVEARDENGVFENKELYRKAPSGFQHKPYNYYVAILKEYFPKEYENLEVKILPENL